MLGPAVDMVLFLVLVLAVNAPAPLLGLEFDDGSTAATAPPGWVVVAAWVVLFPAMGWSRWRLATDGSAEAAHLAPWVVVLAVLCASYAYYTLGLARLTGANPLWLGLGGNIAVVVVATILCVLAWPESRAAALPLAAVAVWTTFASVSVVEELLTSRP